MYLVHEKAQVLIYTGSLFFVVALTSPVPQWFCLRYGLGLYSCCHLHPQDFTYFLEFNFVCMKIPSSKVSSLMEPAPGPFLEPSQLPSSWFLVAVPDISFEIAFPCSQPLVRMTDSWTWTARKQAFSLTFLLLLAELSWQLLNFLCLSFLTYQTGGNYTVYTCRLLKN